LENGKLGAQYQHIEAFVFFVLVNEFRRQAGKVLSRSLKSSLPSFCHASGLAYISTVSQSAKMMSAAINNWLARRSASIGLSLVKYKP